MRTDRWLMAAVLVVAAQSVFAQESTGVASFQKQPPSATVDSQQQPLSASRRAHRSYDGQKKAKSIPSIIQSELDRSRSEEKQSKLTVASAARSAAVQPPAASQPAPLWPVFVSVLIAAGATAVIVYALFLRKKPWFTQPLRPASPVLNERSVPGAASSAVVPSHAAASATASVEDVTAAERVQTHTLSYDEDELVSSASPYAIDDENEMPEAALTMNLINKKREVKKELIQEVMRRVQRKEKPQQIAEALRVGIGEVQLAMTLAKLKK